jgi:hypothetical protein
MFISSYALAAIEQRSYMYAILFQVAKHLNVSPGLPGRAQAAMVKTLEKSLKEGHTYLHWGEPESADGPGTRDVRSSGREWWYQQLSSSLEYGEGCWQGNRGAQGDVELNINASRVASASWLLAPPFLNVTQGLKST